MQGRDEGSVMKRITCIYTATNRALAEVRLCRQGCKRALAAWAVVPVSSYRMFPLSFLFHGRASESGLRLFIESVGI